MKEIRYFTKLIIAASILIIELNSCSRSNDVSNQRLVNAIIKSISFDSTYVAEIKSDLKYENYYLIITKIGQDSSCVFDSLICSKGYHPPIINLNWEKHINVLKISVDNDFGDNIQFYSIDPTTKKMIRQE
jgi:hypothetical protein